MKNVINYYYNMAVANTDKYDNYYTFRFGGDKYKFFSYDRDYRKLIELYGILINSGAFCQRIVPNKDKMLVTIYEGKCYILIKYIINFKDSITALDITKYDIRLNVAYSCNWKILWENKLDYYEYQVNQFGLNFPKIRGSFCYYTGLCELAISLLNFVGKDVLPYVSHERLSSNESISEFLNPINIMIDTRGRDIAEYIKINYVNEKMNLRDALEIIQRLNYTNDEIILLFARLLYPSYYFDMYDKIINGELEEDELNYYTKKSIHYEILLKNIYRYLFFKYAIPEIEWLIN